MAWAVITPLTLAGTASALSWFPPRHSAVQGALVAILWVLALLSALRLYLINVKAVCEPLERATRSVRSLAWGNALPPLRLTYLNETAELLLACQELSEYLTVVLPGTEGARTDADFESMDAVISRLRQVCDEMDQLSAGAVAPADSAAPADALTAPAATVPLPVDEDLLDALRQQIHRLMAEAAALSTDGHPDKAQGFNANAA